MIRINLLGLKKEVSKSRMPSVSMEGAKATVLFLVIIGLAIGALGVHFTMLQTEATQLAEEQRKAEAEKKRLDAVKAQYDQFEKKKQLLTKKINIIESLKKAQTGPVTMLATLASTVEASGQLWLTNFTNDGTRISLDGVAGNVNTVADFITQLKRSGQFTNVEIKESFEQSTAGSPTFVFSISAEIAPQDAPAKPAAPPAKS